MDTDYPTMFSYPDYTTPARRIHAPVPPLDMKKTTVRLDSGLLTPLSAGGGHCDSRRNSEIQGVWNDVAFMPHQSYSPGHPNTPIQGLAQTGFNVSQYDIEDLSQSNALPTPVACTPSYSGAFNFDNVPNAPSSPVGMFEQSTHDIVNMTWPTPNLPTHQEASLTSILGLGSFGDLSVGDASTSSFSESTCYDGPSVMSSFHDGMSTTSEDSPRTVRHNHCIVPTDTLADPRHDISLSLFNNWGGNPPADNDFMTQFGQSPSIIPPPRPASPSWLQGVQFKAEPCFSDSPEPHLIAPRKLTRTKPTSRQVKKERKRQAGQTIHKGCTQAGVVIEYLIDEKAGKHVDEKAGKRVTGAGRIVSKKFECEFYNEGCKKAFARSEHQKRHMKTHDSRRAYPCLIMGCKAGGDGNGSVNRNDNANDHAYTHLKSWLGSDGAVQRARLTGESSRKSKARNSAVDPRTLRNRIRQRHAHEPEKSQKAFDTFNLKAGKDFGIHIDFASETCPMRRCDKHACRTCECLSNRKWTSRRTSKL